MAETTTPSALTVKQWDSDYFTEYVRDNQFAPYMGTEMNSIIQVKEDLTKKKGDRVVLPFVTRLSNAGVTGNNTLEGNEEALDQYGFEVPVDVLRNAVVITDWEEQKNAIDLRNAAKEMLKFWSMEKLRGGGSTDETSADNLQGIIDNLMSIYNGTTYSSYTDASNAAKDTWSVNNSDRVLYGAAVSNYSGDSSTDLANIDDTADKLTAATLSLAKRRAKGANPRIRPIKTKGGEEWFVYFANPIAFRNLKNDSTFATATREGWVRGVPTAGGSEGNPLMRGSDLVYDGVIVKELIELPYILNAGASSIEVAPGFLCGAQALGVAWAQRTKSTQNAPQGTDYGFRHGVGVQEIRGVRKLYANNVQWGVLTHYTSYVE